MQKLTGTPSADGFYMPAEYSKHSGCIMIWPVRPGSWPNNAVEAQAVFTQIANVISESETVYMLAGCEHLEHVREVFKNNKNVKVLEIETDDAWARDMTPTFVSDGQGIIRGIDWEFNAWGGEFDGLYASWDKDDKAASLFCEALKLDCYDAHPFVLEGGSIHTDGEGTLITTKACLLSKGRNPKLSKEEIEEKLKEYLNVSKIIWLPNGIYNDETNEHVDNVCAFVKPGEVVLAWTDDESDPQYKFSMEALNVLENSTDAKGRKIKVHKLPIPEKPVCITEDELSGFVFEEGEDMREAGERLAASYVNFYISNSAVVVPAFGDKNDEAAVRILEKLFPDRKVCPIKARPIITGGGNIHCITQQIPVHVSSFL